MTDSHPEIDKIRARFLEAMAAVKTTADLKVVRDRFVGRTKGELNTALKQISSQPPATRPAFGAAANALKREIDQTLELRELELVAAMPRVGRRRHHIARPRAARRPPPSADAGPRTRRGHLPRHGLPGHRGPGDRRRLAQLRSAEHAARAPGARHAGHALPRGTAWFQGFRGFQRFRGFRACFAARDAASDAHVRACRFATWKRTRRRCA